MAERKITKYRAIFYSFWPLGLDLLTPPERPLVRRPIFCVVGFLCYIAWASSMSIFIIRNFTVLSRFTIVLLILTQSTLSLIKMLVFSIYGKQHKELINEMEQLAAQGNEQEREIWHAANRTGIFISNLNYASVVITALVYFGNPILQMFYKYLKTKEFEYILPFEGILPYDVQNLENYLFTYIFAMIGVQFIANPTTGVDSVFLWYVQNISVHFRILIVKFAAVVSKMHEDRYVEFQQLLTVAITYHNRVIALTNRFNQLFGPIFLVNVTFDCFLTCFLIYILSTSPDLSGLSFSIGAASAILSQLVIYCFGGGIVQAESESISDNLYLLFPWERMSSRMKRLMLLPLMRAQRVSKLTGVFFVLDRNLLIWILRTAFSFAALLFAVTNNEVMLA